MKADEKTRAFLDEFEELNIRTDVSLDTVPSRGIAMLSIPDSTTTNWTPRQKHV